MPRNDDFFSYTTGMKAFQWSKNIYACVDSEPFEIYSIDSIYFYVDNFYMLHLVFPSSITTLRVSVCAISRRLRYDHVWVVILYYDSSDKESVHFFLFLSLITHIWRYNGYMSYLFGLSWWSIKFYFRNKVRSLMTSLGELAIYKMGNVKKNWNTFNYGVLMIRCVTFLKM